jgi:hypothetical protein
MCQQPPGDVLRAPSLYNEPLRLRLLRCCKDQRLRFRDALRGVLPNDLAHNEVAVRRTFLLSQGVEMGLIQRRIVGQDNPMTEITLAHLARQMERLLTAMKGMREEMGSIYAELNSMRAEMANMRDDMRSMRDEIRALE